MADIILHHYETSPYAEKIRVALGIKGLAWSSVQIPRIMPKPDLMPLTGGYRKTPVMQIGADIFSTPSSSCASSTRASPPHRSIRIRASATHSPGGPRRRCSRRP